MFDPIRRAWRGLFRRPATAVPGEISSLGPISVQTRGKSREQIKTELMAQMDGMIPAAILPDVVERVMGDLMRKHGTGGHLPAEQSPRNPSLDDPHHPESVSWERWCEMRRQNARPGWVFCRFGALTNPDNQRTSGVHLTISNCTQVFGIVREHFGVFWQPFWSCGEGDEIVAACLVHLPTGTGVSIFEDMNLACEAAESLSVLPGIEWATINPMEKATFDHLHERMVTAFKFVGMHTAPYCIHEFNPDNRDLGPRLSLFLRDDPADITKENLS